ncbi:hypothetical protein [Arthrobacter flavus]|uniref:Secreted protein n=1 Tax=Arthrobacter flavus TaxID=95172 RepID=A0ABW4Q2V3_9MICC
MKTRTAISVVAGLVLIVVGISYGLSAVPLVGMLIAGAGLVIGGSAVYTAMRHRPTTTVGSAE